MAFFIIKGVFNPESGVPDGDSVRFLADDDSLFDRLDGRVDFKSGGEVQLRYEGIDALEKAAIKPFVGIGADIHCGGTICWRMGFGCEYWLPTTNINDDTTMHLGETQNSDKIVR
jgi:hypothetical protein